MRGGLVLAGALGAALAAHAPAAAAPRVPLVPAATQCTTSIVFGQPQLRERAMLFRATVNVGCPAGVTFSAALRSPNACRLQTSTGARLQYRIFSDPAMQSAVVSCDGPTSPLRGTGRQTFIVYGRVDAPVTAAGQFTGVLVATISL